MTRDHEGQRISIDGHKPPKPEPFVLRFLSVPSTPLPVVIELPPDSGWDEFAWADTIPSELE